MFGILNPTSFVIEPIFLEAGFIGKPANACYSVVFGWRTAFQLSAKCVDDRWNPDLLHSISPPF